MIKSSPEFYSRRIGRRSVGRILTNRPSPNPFHPILPTTHRFRPSPARLGQSRIDGRGNVALSSIVLSRRCGLVCAKSSEIIDTSSSTIATRSTRDAISSFSTLVLYTFPRDSVYRVTCPPIPPLRSLVCTLLVNDSTKPGISRRVVKILSHRGSACSFGRCFSIRANPAERFECKLQKVPRT